jgi:hypothetical protein
MKKTMDTMDFLQDLATLYISIGGTIWIIAAIRAKIRDNRDRQRWVNKNKH